MDESPKVESKTNDDIVATAKKRFQLAEDATRETRILGDEDIKFLTGDQWPEDIKSARKLDKRPIITINRVAQVVRQVTNDSKLNRPAIKVFPIDDKADPETAKVLQGLIRSIENESNAEAAYDTGFENAARRSYGFWRIVTEYESPTSFKQKILIKRIRNPNSVHLDSFSKEKDGSDAAWGFVHEQVSHDDYKSEYPDSELSKQDWSIERDHSEGWLSAESCRIVEYFERVFEDAELVQLSNGEASLKKDIMNALEYYKSIGQMVTPTNVTRKTKIPIIHWYKLNAVEVLDHKIFPGQYIPIIPIYGDEFDINGKLILESVVRNSKDPQRILNYMKSTEAETITLAPKSPFIAAEGQIPKDYSGMWKSSNIRNHAYLIYKPTDHEGHLVPPPQRQVYEPPIQAVTQASQLAAEDIKYTSGVTDAAMGNRSNEQSGIAIQRRANQAQTNNYHFTDNQNISIKHTGRILVDIIPIVYDTPQAVRILGEDGQQEIIRIHEVFKYKGVPKVFDFSVGRYDVSCEMGPGYETKRQEAAASMLEMSKANPQIMGVAGDLVVKNMDWPGASDIADRLRKTLAPGLIDDKDKPPVPPEIKAQMDQMGQLIDQLTKTANESTELIKTKKMELESRERIEFAKLDTQVAIKDLEIKAKALDATYQAELANIKFMLEKRLSVLDMDQPINNEFENEESIPDQDMIPQDDPQQQLTGELTPGQTVEEMP